MGKMSGKPGPDPRGQPAKTSLQPLPSGPSFGGPSRPPLKEVKRRTEQALEDLGQKFRGEK